jgi:WD40 repeat protein
LAASLSQDGRYALVSSVNHGAGFWDLEQNQLKFQWRHNDNPEDGITVSDISPDGSRAVTCDKRTFVIWNTNTGKAYGYWQAPEDITAAALSDKGRYLLLGLKNGKVIHIAMETGRRIEFTGHGKEPIAAVDLSPNGEWAFSGGQDYRAILWNTRTGQPRYIFSHQTRVTQVRLDTKGEQAFTSGTRGNAYVWDLTDGSQRSQLALKPREYVISSAAFSADGKLLATGAPGREVVLWETRSGQRLFSWKAKTRDQWKPSGAIVWAVAFDSEGKHVISEASSGFGQKWRIPPLP